MEFSKLSEEIEQPEYYREQLVYNYLYKGPVLEWYMRVKLRLEGYYKMFHQHLPKRGKILDIGFEFHGYTLNCYVAKNVGYYIFVWCAAQLLIHS